MNKSIDLAGNDIFDLRTACMARMVAIESFFDALPEDMKPLYRDEYDRMKSLYDRLAEKMYET